MVILGEPKNGFLVKMFEEQRKRIEAIADGIIEIQVLCEVSRIIRSKYGRRKIDIEIKKDEQRQIGCLTPIKTSLDSERSDISSYVSISVSHYSQILHYLNKNRLVFTPLGVIKPLSVARNKYSFDIGAAGLLGDYKYPIEVGAAGILHLNENPFKIGTADSWVKLNIPLI
jgi:hypothetical protein